MILRNSEVQDFLRCRLRWDYRWNRKLEPKKKSSKLMIGTLFHKFLEAYYNRLNVNLSDFIDALDHGIEEMRALYDQEVAAKIEDGVYDPVEAQEAWELLEGLANWYHEYWSQKQQTPWEVIATEQTYYINMETLEWTTEYSPEMEESDDIWYECTLDLVIRDNDKLFVVDYKTVSSLEYFEKGTEIDRQISRYLFAANVVYKDQPIHGLIYNLIKKELPKEPQELKKGGLSKAKDQRTTYTKYMNKLIELGIAKQPEDGAVNPETWTVFPNGYAVYPEHAEVLQLLLQRETPAGNDFLRRILVKRNDAEINNAMNEFMQVAVMIRRIRRLYRTLEQTGKKLHEWEYPIYRTCTKDCTWDCGYYNVCVAGMDGSDVTYLENELLQPVEEKREVEAAIDG